MATNVITKEQFEREVSRLDRRIEVVTGAAEDRMVGRLSEMESRIMRRMDQRFDDMAALMQQNDSQLDDKINRLDDKIESVRVQLEDKIDRLDDKIESVRTELLVEMRQFRQEVLAALGQRPPSPAA